MKTFFKILIGVGGLLILLFTQCRKKPKTPDISDWLEKEYPNRYEVLATYTDDIIRNLSFSIKHSIVAEKSNPMVQTKLHWNANFEDLKLTKGIVDSSFMNAKSDYEDAQSLYKILHNQGLTNISLSIKNGSAMVMIFAEPTPEHRKKSLELLEPCFNQWAKTADYDISISYEEPSEKDKHFKEIVPLLYWHQSSAQYMGMMLYSTFSLAEKVFSAKEMDKYWAYNTESNRFSKCIEHAQKEAEKWASEHIKRPITFLETSEFTQNEKNTVLVNFKFPFIYQSNKPVQDAALIEKDGYITLEDYNAEKNTFGQIKLTKE
jgi:hypothetical protein